MLAAVLIAGCNESDPDNANPPDAEGVQPDADATDDSGGEDSNDDSGEANSSDGDTDADGDSGIDPDSSGDAGDDSETGPDANPTPVIKKWPGPCSLRSGPDRDRDGRPDPVYSESDEPRIVLKTVDDSQRGPQSFYSTDYLFEPEGVIECIQTELLPLEDSEPEVLEAVEVVSVPGWRLSEPEILDAMEWDPTDFRDPWDLDAMPLLEAQEVKWSNDPLNPVDLKVSTGLLIADVVSIIPPPTGEDVLLDGLEVSPPPWTDDDDDDILLEATELRRERWGCREESDEGGASHEGAQTSREIRGTTYQFGCDSLDILEGEEVRSYSPVVHPDFGRVGSTMVLEATEYDPRTDRRVVTSRQEQEVSMTFDEARALLALVKIFPHFAPRAAPTMS